MRSIRKEYVMKKSILALLLCAILCASALVSCTAPETAPYETVTSDAPVNTEPLDPVDLPDYSKEIASLLDLKDTAEGEFEFSVLPEKNGVAVTGYRGSADKIKIPASINGYAVLSVGDGAFRDMKTLKALSIPATVTSVGKEILAGCTSLVALQTPIFGTNEEGLSFLGTLFGAERYEDNPLDIPASLAHLRICGTMETLSAYALYDCNDLVTLTLPKTLTKLERFSLSKCESLEVIEGLEEIVSVGEHGMSYCSSLKAIAFGTKLERLAFASLEGCRALREITIPFVGESKTENTYLGYVFGARYADFSQGFYPHSLLRVILLSGCETLGTNAFYECATLREIVLPDTLSEIGIRAFYGCAALYAIVLPDSVKYIRESAFVGCDGLVSVQFGKELTSIGINAFMNCDSLEKVSLPASLSSLPASAFAGCLALREVDLGGVTDVGAEAFRHCSAVKTVRALKEVSFGRGNDSVKNVLYPK